MLSAKILGTVLTYKSIKSKVPYVDNEIYRYIEYKMFDL